MPANVPQQPASVSLKDGKLTISANNSDLTQILQELVHISGMKVLGSDKGPRVFGQYGPAEAHQVLSSLLAGSGYDFIMVGGATGSMPRELVLSKHNDEVASREPDQTESIGTASERRGPEKREQEPLGVGAVYPVPPQPSQDENERTQQNLQRLQRIHQDQQDSQAHQ